MGCWEVFNEKFFQSHNQNLTGLVSLKNNFKISLKTSHFTGQNSPFQASQGRQVTGLKTFFCQKLPITYTLHIPKEFFKKIQYY